MIYSRDIILDFVGKNLEDVLSVVFNVVIVFFNLIVVEMTIFFNIFFFVIRGSYFKFGNIFFS